MITMHWTDLFTKVFDQSFASRWNGTCNGWNKGLTVSHVISDLLIWVAYMVIPIMLVRLAQIRKDLPFNIFFFMFAIFIIGCGLTHLVGAITAFYPYYYIDFWVKAFTAAASIGTAWLLWKSFNQMVTLPNPFTILSVIENTNIKLENLNRELSLREEILKRTNAELEQFAYIVSHDLKAPIRAISGLATWIKEDLGNSASEDIKNKLDLLKSRVILMNNLIDGVLQYSRIGRINTEMQKIDINEIISSTLELLDKREFNIIVQPNLPVIYGNRVVVGQVFQNLLSNSIKHHPRNDGKIKVSCHDLGDFWEFCVEDDGKGIPKDDQKDIFIIFNTFRTKANTDSTGIGLALCKKIVEQSGGEIWVESDEGFGAKFFFTWPKNK
jgi:signal transduction histidine kinase